MFVRNFKESVDFYKEVFGLELKEEGKSMSGLDYKIVGLSGKLMLCLYEDPNVEVKGLSHFGLNVENFSEVLEILQSKNIPYQYGGHVEYDNSRSVYIEDPSGYEIEISEVFAGGL
jgi:catechol 2,3-dioxygenase-like lactoylglutathione lyase family enzyme